MKNAGVETICRDLPIYALFAGCYCRSTHNMRLLEMYRACLNSLNLVLICSDLILAASRFRLLFICAVLVQGIPSWSLRGVEVPVPDACTVGQWKQMLGDGCLGDKILHLGICPETLDHLFDS